MSANRFPAKIGLPFLMLTIVSLASAQQAVAPVPQGTIEPEEEIRRYQVEVILFTYGPGVTAGTEVFVPEAPPNAVTDGSVSIEASTLADGAMESLASQPSEENFVTQAQDVVAADPGEERVPVYGDRVLLPGDSDFLDEELETLPGASSIDLRVLTPDELTMTGVHERLLTLDAYRPVMWSGWTQIVREDAETPIIRLRRLGNVPLEFSGDVKLYLSRFLHLVVDLSLEAATDTAFSGSRPDSPGYTRSYRDDYGRYRDAYRPPPVLYRISEGRIMRSDDIRYFDHPKFGMLAKVTRVEDIEDGTPPEIDLTRPRAPAVGQPATTPRR